MLTLLIALSLTDLLGYCNDATSAMSCIAYESGVLDPSLGMSARKQRLCAACHRVCDKGQSRSSSRPNPDAGRGILEGAMG